MLAERGIQLLRAALGCALSAVFVNAALAAPINYGNFNGNDVMFIDVTEDSATDPTPLYGSPTPSGNGLTFTPTAAFTATSSNGTADITDGKLTATIMSINPLFAMTGLILSEFGDYTLQGTGTAATQASVSAPVFVNLLAVDGVGVTPQLMFAGNLTMTPSGGTYDLVNDPGIGAPWSGSLFVDLQAGLIALGYGANQRVTKISLGMDNTLTATSELGTIAFIAKKGVNGPSVTVLPEPTTWLLGLTGAVGIAALARRRREPRRLAGER